MGGFIGYWLIDETGSVLILAITRWPMAPARERSAGVLALAGFWAPSLYPFPVAMADGWRLVFCSVAMERGCWVLAVQLWFGLVAQLVRAHA